MDDRRGGSESNGRVPLGARLAELRLHAGLTQEQLAHRMHVAGKTVRDWEHDRSYPQPDRLDRLRRVLHCTTRELLG